MSVPVRLAIFAASLLAAFAAAWGAGTAVSPILDEPVPAHAMGDDVAAHGAEHQDEAGAVPGVPGGLSTSAGGYTLDLDDDRVAAGPRTISFTITDSEGEALTDYEVEHGKRLHLIAVRRDFTGYQHVHPAMSSSGVWYADLNLSPGIWRVFADFVPFDGDALTLGTDLVVPGRGSVAAAAPDDRSSVVAGYTVELLGDLRAGSDSLVRLRVTRDGEPVTDLEPYLGALGHLVALRAGDLAYLHVHPERGGPRSEVPFVAEVPNAGDFHLYFDFKHAGVVRTAQFHVSAEGGQHDDD